MSAQHQRGELPGASVLQRFLPAHHKDLEMKNKTTAALLAFLLGGFAADQFYLNERPKRLWWLLLPPVAGVLALIAAIKYITMSEVEFDSRYNGTVSE